MFESSFNSTFFSSNSIFLTYFAKKHISLSKSYCTAIQFSSMIQKCNSCLKNKIYYDSIPPRIMLKFYMEQSCTHVHLGSSQTCLNSQNYSKHDLVVQRELLGIRVATRKPLEVGQKIQLLITELFMLVEPKTITNTFIL